MKSILKVIGLLAAAMLLLQIPFAFRAWQIDSVTRKIADSDASRSLVINGPREYVGVIHVHSVHSGELSDAFDEMLNAACDNRLDFVLLTEHFSPAFNTSALTLNGWYGSILFIPGNEVQSKTGDRFLMLPGSADAAEFRLRDTSEVIDRIHARNGIAEIAYPEKFGALGTTFDGIEVVNLNTQLRAANPLLAVLDYPWSGQVNRSLAIARFLRRPDENLSRFDEVAATRRVFLTAGLDAHSAIGFHMFGDEIGSRIVGMKVDPYTDIFRIARMHVLIDGQLDSGSLLNAIKDGKFFVGFDVLGDTRGFRFTTSDGIGVGGETTFASGMKLRATSPQSSRIVILRNGQKVAESSNVMELTTDATGPAAYRVEVYREGLGAGFDNVPWILSNPIYVR